MPHSRSAKKRMRQALTRRSRNRIRRSSLRTALKRVRDAKTRDEALARFQAAEKLLDRAAHKHLIHRNTAARYKSRLKKVIGGL